MTELTNESHGDESYRDVSDGARKVARRQLLEALQKPEFSGREEVITNLINSETFWNGVFKLGAADINGTMDIDMLRDGAITVNAMVESNAGQEIDDLAEVIEGMAND